MEVNTIAVIGAGTMGRGIAYAGAVGGYGTILEDISPAVLEQGLAYIGEALEEGVARGKITPQQKQQALAHLSTASSVEGACREADLVIEAMPEEMELKLEIFTLLDKFAKPGSIFAINTSSLSITEMATITCRPEKCVGMHFFNPVPKMKLLEIVHAIETSDDTISTLSRSGPPHGQGGRGRARIAGVHHQPYQRADRQRSLCHARRRNRLGRRHRQGGEARPEPSDGPV
jgi:3-hydroxybutyryl-CoA dehydrogenase